MHYNKNTDKRNLSQLTFSKVNPCFNCISQHSILPSTERDPITQAYQYCHLQRENHDHMIVIWQHSQINAHSPSMWQAQDIMPCSGKRERTGPLHQTWDIQIILQNMPCSGKREKEKWATASDSRSNMTSRSICTIKWEGCCKMMQIFTSVSSTGLPLAAWWGGGGRTLATLNCWAKVWKLQQLQINDYYSNKSLTWRKKSLAWNFHFAGCFSNQLVPVQWEDLCTGWHVHIKKSDEKIAR